MNEKLKYTSQLFIKLFIFAIFLFARTFTGVTIFGFRLGEYFIGGSLFLLIIYGVLIPLTRKKYFLDNKKLNFFVVSLMLSFFIYNLISQVDFINPFIFKTSSYIWSFGALVLGYNFATKIGFKLNEEDIYLSLFGLFVIYIFSTRGISENLQNVFLNYTDKFEYPKGSDLILAFIFVFYLILNKKNYSKNSLMVLFLFGALYTPLFLVKSRSGFFALVIFSLLTLPEFRKKIKKIDIPIFISVVCSIIVFILSTSWVVSKDIAIDEEIDAEIKYAITSRYRTINDNVYEEVVLGIKLFYFEDGRIFSSDGNLNWRFQIWQDIFSDMYSANNLLTGYGYDDIIPAMDSDQRYGLDKKNINVHNYLMHILSRGGLLHVFLVLAIYFYLFQKFKELSISRDFTLLVLPLLFNSLFDPCMENAHYPIILYFIIGLALKKPIILTEGR